VPSGHKSSSGSCCLFNRSHQAKRIFPVDFANFCRGIAALQQPASQDWEFRHVVEFFRNAPDSIEVAADTARVDAGDFHDVIDVREHVVDRGALPGAWPAELRNSQPKLIWMTPPFFAMAQIISSVMLRGMGEIERHEE
jgi:hypothetical protein